VVDKSEVDKSDRNKVKSQEIESETDTSGSDSKETDVKQDDPPAKNHDPVHRFTKIVLTVVVFLFIWYITADRLAPWTDQARVQAYVVPIVPQISGRITKVNVVRDQIVQAGDLLVQIDPTDYELAVQRAESALAVAGQDIGAGTAAVTTAQAKLVESQANLSHLLVQSIRIFEVEKKGVVSKSDGDKARAAVAQARAQVDSAQSELEKAKQALGKKGKDNPKIRSALSALKQAQLDLSRTTLYAPSHGGITNLLIDEGHYASSGKAVMTFIAVDDVWIQANLRENSVANIKVGNAVEIALDVAPGRIFKGTVTSLGFAVDQASGGKIGDLTTIKGDSGWLRDAQRFPIIITFDDNSVRGLRRLGGQADVQVYTGDNWIINTLGWIWIRTLSWLSYVY